MLEEIDSVLDAYGLGDFSSARRSASGYINETWVVQTDQGQYFVKRRCPHLCRPDLIGAQHDLVDWLRHQGFPAPVVLRTLAGDSFLVLAGALYEIHEFIQGDPYLHGRLAHLQAAALTLGQYHSLVQNREPPSVLKRGTLYGPGHVESLLTGAVEIWDLKREAVLERICQSLWSHTAELTDCFAAHSSLPQLVIHGDYYAENLLFDGDKVVGLVDYDKMRWQPRVVELAEALIYFASPRPGPLQVIVYPGVLLLDMLAVFLESYSRAVVLEAEEVRALPDMIRCIWLQVSLQRLLEAQRPAKVREAFMEVLTLADWARTNTQHIVELACLAGDNGGCGHD